MENCVSNSHPGVPPDGGACSRTRRLWLGWIACCLLVMVPFFLAVPASAADPVAKEPQIKAAFIYNFLKFVEWPAGSFSAEDAPIVVGVVGGGPVGPALEASVKERKINGRAIVVKNLASPASAGNEVHVLWFEGGDERRLMEALEAVRGKAVLTVGETEKFALAGGMITFVAESETMRFEINPESAQRESLKISAQLQKLAKTIRK